MCVEEGLEAVAIAVLTRFGKWSPLEVRVLVAKAKLELKSAALHSMLGLYVFPAIDLYSVSANLDLHLVMLCTGGNRYQVEADACIVTIEILAHDKEKGNGIYITAVANEYSPSSIGTTTWFKLPTHEFGARLRFLQ
jgi:hypothetical protein